MYNLYCNIKGNDYLIKQVKEAVVRAGLADKTAIEKSNFTQDFQLYKKKNPDKKNLHLVEIIDEDSIFEAHPELKNLQLNQGLTIKAPSSNGFLITLRKNQDQSWIWEGNKFYVKNGGESNLITNLAQAFECIDQTIRKGSKMALEQFKKGKNLERQRIENKVGLSVEEIFESKIRTQDWQNKVDRLHEVLTEENIRRINDRDILRRAMVVLVLQGSKDRKSFDKLELMLNIREDLDLSHVYHRDEPKSNQFTLVDLAMRKEDYSVIGLFQAKMDSKKLAAMIQGAKKKASHG